jgi:hypothetical protein
VRHGSRRGAAQEVMRVTGSAVFIALVVMVIGGFIGWHLRHASGARSDLKTHKTRIPNFRKARNESWFLSAALIALTLLLLRALLK